MKTEIISSTEKFFSLEADWQRIEAVDPDVSFYSRFATAKAWWSAHQGDPQLKLWVITVWDSVNIVGIAPLVIEKSGNRVFSWRTVRFLGMGDYLGVLIDRSFRDQMTIIKEIFRVLEENRGEWDRIFLEYIPARSLFAAYLLQSKYNRNFGYLVECPIINRADYADFAAYEADYRPTKAKRARRKLQEMGFQLETRGYSPEIMEQIIALHQKEQQYLAQEKKRKERKSIFEDEQIASYIREVADRSPENVVFFTCTTEQHQLIAYGACWCYHGMLHWWNCGYDPEYERFSPVKALILEMVEYFFEHPIARTLDLGAGRYVWKFDWTKDFILNYQLDILHNHRNILWLIYKAKKAWNILQKKD